MLYLKNISALYLTREIEKVYVLLFIMQTHIKYIMKSLQSPLLVQLQEEMDELEESSILADVAHMPARVKCACLGWHTAKEMLEKGPGCKCEACHE